jgi:uncharacterized membrane protein YdfJ with MMPL/SSD domain
VTEKGTEHMVAAATAVLLLPLGSPFLSIRFTSVDAGVLPPSASARQVDDALRTRFPDNAQALHVVPQPGSAVAADPRGVAGLDVFTTMPPLSDGARSLVESIRGLPASPPLLVGGATASFVDLQSSLLGRLPLAVAIVAVATVLVLFAMTGSVVLPLKAVLMNGLSLAAAFGALVLIFQHGPLTGLLQYTSQGAVAIGLERTGRVVTAAAVLFCIAIGAFATSSVVFIKEVGVGTALAVLIDATVLRALLVPSLMALLGRWNWWSPRPLRALHRRLGLDRLEGRVALGAATPGT